ncbi:DUF1523 domain-containing protein [Labrys okinawensis]|uniref:DUF1523 domain-containing protein n=1 Tax=Labrys okinawensis TaxID=346911 RepID=A0A2S9Q464_9HYPH|nr:DUF1523 family protein [Labrys okinawensis]PRH84153.1 DUF1523 domain-containing protein [Labrys okinawensis]
MPAHTGEFMLRLFKWFLIVLVLVVGYCWLDQVLPRYDVVRIVGTDTKRLDSSGFFDSEAPNVQATNTRDVRFINTVYPSGALRVYRNEDTDWGFPWYYKFDSGNLMAAAQSFQSSSESPKWVVIKSYGWRVTYLTMFPNALSIRAATGPDEYVIPWLRIFVFGGLAIGLIWLYFRLRRFKRERIDPMLTRIEGHVSAAADAVDERAVAVSSSATGFMARIRRWLDSWKPKNQRRYK